VKRTGKNTGRKQQPARRRARAATKTRAKSTRQRSREPKLEVAVSELLRELSEHTGVSPADAGGDVDADGKRAQSSDEETVGGRGATPGQDVVDELARPLGVERPSDAPVITSEEMLSARDRRRWRIEQHADEEARDAEDDKA
jgi:hypothetical protein